MKKVKLASIIALALLSFGCDFICHADITGDNKWNYRQEGRDYFHSNEAWLRPWDGSDETHGKFVGNYSYQVTWGGISQIGDAQGGFVVSKPRDYQWHAWCYVYVSIDQNVTITAGGDCVPRVFLRYNFDNPVSGSTLSLLAGWNRIDVTGYNQNSGYAFTFNGMASEVDIQNSTQIDLSPQADFLYSPTAGWSDVTAFDFTDNSTNSPTSWLWDMDNDGNDDYTTQDVYSHLYSVSAGATEIFDIKLQVSGYSQNDTILKEDIVEIYGLPIASFDPNSNDLEVEFTNQSIEPGKAELGGYQYSWDMNGNGVFDDSSEENPIWVFPGPDQYEVSLRVQNGAGTAIYSETITVGPQCGDSDHPYPLGDISGPDGQPDCWVNLHDFAALASNWLSCTSPKSPCNHTP